LGGEKQMRCPRCDFENTNASNYCENCGTYLVQDPQYPTAQSTSDASQASSTHQAGQSEYADYPYESSAYSSGYASNTFNQQQYNVPSPPPSNGHNIPIAPPPPLLEPQPLAVEYNTYGNYGTQSQIFENQKISEPQLHKQSLPGRIIRGILYFLALVLAGLGIFGAITSFNSDNLTSGIGIILLFSLFIVGTFVFFLIRRFQHLRFPSFLLWLLATTLGAFVIIILGFAILGESSKASSFFLGIIFLLYGLILAALAVW
jgi:hypothetical protein